MDVSHPLLLCHFLHPSFVSSPRPTSPPDCSLELTSSTGDEQRMNKAMIFGSDSQAVVREGLLMRNKWLFQVPGVNYFYSQQTVTVANELL